VKIKILPDKYQGKTMPPNFYAELARTPDSIMILRASKQIEEFNKQLMDEATPIMIRKAILWTFGMIGSTDYGVDLLESYEVIEEIINIAENSTYLSVRGTALFSLSMICRCERGKEILKNYKWYRADPQGITCLPSNHMKIFKKIDKDFEAGICNYEEKWTAFHASKKKYELKPGENEVLTSIVKIGNSLKSAEGEKEVKYALTQNPEMFSSSHMIHLVTNILSIYKFKHSTRKRIFQLIDKSINSNKLEGDWEYYI
jgi:rapamycin-insensitive companion of mTOR